ncbi:unnamed protein product [Dibothriocephalus latus]|uniref:Sperm microtubule inner protein 1 C-terminal domain-containing protein n=1 Tax=Dibothriocephalus latus TaxID=60516 RepID=A0A3P7LUI3_DIBLA|nr:unnamed protein product [Dibothriocephalus latus]
MTEKPPDEGVQRTEFLKDAIRKVDNSQLDFFVKHKEQIMSTEVQGTASTLFRKRLQKLGVWCEKLAKEVEERQKRIEAERLAREEAMRQREEIDFELDMRPASPKTKSALYNGVSHDFEGRHHYLKLRNKLSPEVKYPVKETTAWDLGWRLSDTIKPEDIKSSPFNRISIVENSFFTNSGIPFETEYRPTPRVWYK